MVSVAPLPGVCLPVSLPVAVFVPGQPASKLGQQLSPQPASAAGVSSGWEGKKQTKNFKQFAKPNRSRHLGAETRAVVGNKVPSSPPRWPGFPEAQPLFSAQQRHKLRFSFQVT